MLSVCKLFISHKRLVLRHFLCFTAKMADYGETPQSIRNWYVKNNRDVCLAYKGPFCKRTTPISRMPEITLRPLIKCSTCTVVPMVLSTEDKNKVIEYFHVKDQNDWPRKSFDQWSNIWLNAALVQSWPNFIQPNQL